MKITRFLSPLCWMWLAVTPLSAQDPTPAATPDDIPAPAATPAPPPEKCPVCGMDKNADARKDDKPAQPAAASDETDFSQLEQAWADAIVHDDMAALERIVADEYMSVSPDGAVAYKAEHLAAAKMVAGKIDSFRFSNVRVRVYGETAIVTGDGMIHWTTNEIDGAPVTPAPFRWIDVFVKRDGRWQAVASQATNVSRSASGLGAFSSPGT